MINQNILPLNEQAVAKAFDKQSANFDKTNSDNTIVQYKRDRVRNHINSLLHSRVTILELNAGTGEDAIYFANRGHHVHATDISAGMLEKLSEKSRHLKLENRISTELCSFTALNNLKQRGPFDLIFSNFAGLNCTRDLDKVLSSFDQLVKPGGLVTLVVLPKICFWELALVLKGKFRTATRRLFASGGARSHVEGYYFKSWYYQPSFIRKHLQSSFDQVSLEGLCTIVPPSYIEGFAEKYPKLYMRLKLAENRKKTAWPWRSVGDYYIISLRKKG